MTSLLPLLLALTACASAPPPAPPSAAMDAGPAGGPENAQRLARLWQERTGPGSRSDFSIGPGDVLQISVPGLIELEKHTSRVSSEGTISLPLLGVVSVAGLTEELLAAELRARLEASVMYDPSVVVFLSESRHRTVGVIGAVYNPGFYDSVSEQDTILDVISLAGGMTPTAADRAHLLPASRNGQSSRVVPASVDSAAEALRRSDAIVIDFDPRTHGGNSSFLNLPVRPGDVVVVPERGHVLVKGWVHNPGSYEISSGLTVLGAVTAAGGTRYAADKSAVELLRSKVDGETISHRFDLKRLQSGQEPDAPVRSGDVIDISHSTPKLIASSFLEFLGSVLSVGTRF